MGHFGREVAVSAEQKQIFVLRIAGKPGVDSIRAIRRLLKYAGRQLGLRALDVREERDAQETITDHTAP
jgi:hypothetical protein